MPTFLSAKNSAHLNALLLLIPSVYSFFHGSYVLGVLFLFVALVLEFSGRNSAKGSLGGALSALTTMEFKERLIWVLWLALGLVTLTVRSDLYGFVTEKPQWLGWAQLWMQFALFLALIGAIRSVETPKKASTDLSSSAARIWFGIIFALAIVMLTYKVGSPEGCYGSDESVGIIMTRWMRDYQNYMQGYYLNYWTKPFFTYLTLFLWHWMPNATDVFIARLTAIVNDLGTVWLLYLCGKELGGRRTGLWTAALGAVSKPLMELTVMSTGVVSAPFALLLSILFALRLFKKTDIKHYLQFGLALGLNVYMTDYTRLETIFLIGVVFVWTLWQKKNRVWAGPMSWVILTNILALAVYCFYMTFGFNQTLMINQWFMQYPIPCFVALLAIFLALVGTRAVLGPQAPSVKKNQGWFAALLGLWICVFLDYPFISGCWTHVSETLKWNGTGLAQVLSDLIGRLYLSVQILFYWGGRPFNMGLEGDSFFSFGEVMVIFLGLAYFFAKPSWSKFFIFLTVLVGILPHVLLTATHNVRLMDSVGPFLLLAAMGLNDLWVMMTASSARRWVGGLVLAVLIGFWGWSAWTTYSRVYFDWFDRTITFDTGAQMLAAESQKAGDRVYFCDNAIDGESLILCEGLSAHRICPVNVIYLKPGEKPQDVVIIVHDFLSKESQAMAADIKRYFPGVAWQRKYDNNYCVIPSQALLRPEQKMFMLRNEPASGWKREYALNDAGISFDIVEYEDRAAHVDDPFLLYDGKRNQELIRQKLEVIRYLATLHIAKEGDYVVHYQGENRSWLKLDGHKIVDLVFFELDNADHIPVYLGSAKEGDVKVHLTQGDHPVEVVMNYQRSLKSPEFWLRPAGTPAPGVSLWKSLDF